jgi:hypothetical protein
MPPFNTKEVTCYLLWIAIGLMVAGIAILLIYHAQGHDRVPENKPGPAVQLYWPRQQLPPWA